MKKLEFNISINATPAKVWQVLWNDSTYRQWTSAFTEGSYAVSDWKEGGKIQFLAPDGGGMYSKIAVSKPNELMSFEHIGEIKNFEEQPLTDETKAWSGAKENYYLTEENGNTALKVEVDLTGEFEEYFSKAFPKALALVKEIAEKPIVITIETTVAAPVTKVWENWKNPQHIIKWNNASEDLRTGGKFLSRMAAKDGSMSFDFTGTYTAVEQQKKIEYNIADGRKVSVSFVNNGNTTKVVEAFEAETMNTLELQRGGWQSILNNFKKYTEEN
jgi:uncharacterized protein YndB with AHSA1/START domain